MTVHTRVECWSGDSIDIFSSAFHKEHLGMIVSGFGESGSETVEVFLEEEAARYMATVLLAWAEYRRGEV